MVTTFRLCSPPRQPIWAYVDLSQPENSAQGVVSIAPTLTGGFAMRRSGRISKEIPVLLSGGDAAGLQFSEKTHTLMLSRHGASILSRHKLIPEQEAYLRDLASNREIEVRVCGEIGEREDGHIYGVAFADQTADFWRIEFPPAPTLTRDLQRVTLECSGCHNQSTVQFDGTEMDVYVVNEGALRYCPNCALSTIWKIATERVAPPDTPIASLSAMAPIPAPAPVVSAPLAVPAAAPLSNSGPAPNSSAALGTNPSAAPVATPPARAAQPNRRSERRTKVKCNVCIRLSGIADEVAPCEDMSRGGFSFHSARPYSVETTIKAAVPYTPGASIFVPAQIANVFPLQGGKLFRYGVAYLRSGKKG